MCSTALCCYGGEPDGELHAVLRRSGEQPELLARVSVAWQSGQMAVSGSMNRSAGMTEERIDAWRQPLIAYRELHPWPVARDNTVQTLAPGDWQPVLASRRLCRHARALVWAD